MSITIPEKPLFVYPSLARKLGVEVALLFYICHEQLNIAGIPDKSGYREAVISARQWLNLTDFWTREKVVELAGVLSAQSPLAVVIHPSGSVRIVESVSRDVKFTTSASTEQQVNIDRGTSAQTSIADSSTMVSQQEEQHRITRLPVVDTPPPYSRRPLPLRNNMRDRGPAPAFGGSIGWNSQKDELQQLFDRHEERNQQLHMMHLGWTPSEMFFSILPRHQIPREFVETCLDEFILYYIDKERKESNWDQKFLAWVKRAWVQKQTRDAHEQRNKQQRHTSGAGINDENTRRDTKEKRKRVTAAIMDIKDTDW